MAAVDRAIAYDASEVCGTAWDVGVIMTTTGDAYARGRRMKARIITPSSNKGLEYFTTNTT